MKATKYSDDNKIIYKQNVEDQLANITSLSVSKFKIVGDPDEKWRVAITGQDMVSVYPNDVETDNNGVYSVNDEWNETICKIVKAIQELEVRVAALE